MKAAVIVLAVLLVLAHPAAAVAVLGAELAACAVLTGVIIRALRPLSVPASCNRMTAPRADPWWMTATAVIELTLWLALACLLVLAGTLARACRALRRRRAA